jgi:hypothetical protein
MHASQRGLLPILPGEFVSPRQVKSKVKRQKAKEKDGQQRKEKRRASHL